MPRGGGDKKRDGLGQQWDGKGEVRHETERGGRERSEGMGRDRRDEMGWDGVVVGWSGKGRRDKRKIGKKGMETENEGEE